MNDKHRRVAVTGVGSVTPLGPTAETTWRGVVEGVVGYRYWEPPDRGIRSRFFGRLPESSRGGRSVPRSLRRQLPAFARLACDAADEAIGQAFPARDWVRTYSEFRAGVVIGTGWGGLDEANANNNEYRKTGLSSPFATIQSMNHVATAAVAKLYRLRGPQLTPIAACAAGGVAIGEGAELIRSGRADLVVVGGAESLTEIFNVQSIEIINALTKETTEAARACCPFDARRSGFVLSEGAAVLILEELEGARRRGAKIWGEVTGYGNTTDAHDFTAPAPDGVARVEAIRQALDQAGLDPQEIDYINAHGTSTPLNDVDETNAIKVALGRYARHVPVSSTKSYTGHLIGAAGALETVFCLQAMRDGLVPATIHLESPDPDCDLDYVPNEHRRARLRRVLNLSFGFGGANAALVIEEARP
jgi:3-oxoacyl-[acyl-carrier-protein] synthase II